MTAPPILDVRWQCAHCGRFVAESAVDSEDRIDPGAYYGVSSRTWARCPRCGDRVTTLSSDDLCDGCVAEDDREARREAVIRAAIKWRAQFGKPAESKLPRQAALIAAVDALAADPEHGSARAMHLRQEAS